MSYRGRFAPSPTGQLHFGSLVAALGSYLRARAVSGVWLIRIEDLDPPREVPGAAADIVRTLAAFGMLSDEPVVYQSARVDLYAAALNRLKAAGKVFFCRCSRNELAASRGLHRGPCKPRAHSGGRGAWRLRIPALTLRFDDLIQGEQIQDLARDVGNFVLRRNDGYFAYQLAVVVDDAEQGISEIVRGADLLDSTPRQIYLQQQLDYATPAYAHLPLAVDEHGAKLSKQHRALAMDATDPLPALRHALGFLGVSPLPVPRTNRASALLDAAAESFNLRNVPRHVSLTFPHTTALAGP